MVGICTMEHLVYGVIYNPFIVICSHICDSMCTLYTLPLAIGVNCWDLGLMRLCLVRWSCGFTHTSKKKGEEKQECDRLLNLRTSIWTWISALHML